MMVGTIPIEILTKTTNLELFSLGQLFSDDVSDFNKYNNTSGLGHITWC